jgi:type IV secretory pathway VirB3-like protein
MNYEKLQRSLAARTRKWWFLLVFILLQFVPSYASKGVDPSEISEFIVEILSHSLLYSYSVLYPIFKIIPLFLVICLLLFKNRVTRPFSVYVGITYVLFAFLQNIAMTEEYGLGIIISNLAMFLIVAGFWFWEAIVKKNDFTSRTIPTWKYWVIPFAFLAFWYPANPDTFMPDFNPAYFFTNEAGLYFCMMTPVYLAILTLYYPRVNEATLRVTSLVGTIIGIWNMFTNFFADPSLLWWNGILHIPLFTISIYGLILSYKMKLSK